MKLMKTLMAKCVVMFDFFPTTQCTLKALLACGECLSLSGVELSHLTLHKMPCRCTVLSSVQQIVQKL